MERLPENSSTVIDGMALVQRLQANHMYFSDVSKTIFSKALREGGSSVELTLCLMYTEAIQSKMLRE